MCHQHTSPFCNFLDIVTRIVNKNRKQEQTKNGSLRYLECYQMFFRLRLIVRCVLLSVEKITAYPVKHVDQCKGNQYSNFCSCCDEYGFVGTRQHLVCISSLGNHIGYREVGCFLQNI